MDRFAVCSWQARRSPESGVLGAVPAAAQELDYVTLDYGTSGTFLTGIRGDTIVGNYTHPTAPIPAA